jgi:hypothetical protein
MIARDFQRLVDVVTQTDVLSWRQLKTDVRAVVWSRVHHWSHNPQAGSGETAFGACGFYSPSSE